MAKAAVEPTRAPAAAQSAPAPDRQLLQLIGDWRVFRAQQTLEWARVERDESLGNECVADLTSFDQMKNLEDVIGVSSPKSIRGAAKMLAMVRTILSHEHPEDYFAEGPVVEIISHVIEALDWCDGDEPIGKLRRKADAPLDDGNGEVEPAAGDAA